MIRTLVFLLLAVIAIGALATPFFAGIGLLLLLFLFASVIWWIGLAVSTRGRPGELLVQARVHRFLGPGGPDDPFADVPYADEQVAAFASRKGTVGSEPDRVRASGLDDAEADDTRLIPGSSPRA